MALGGGAGNGRDGDRSDTEKRGIGNEWKKYVGDR